MKYLFTILLLSSFGATCLAQSTGRDTILVSNNHYIILRGDTAYLDFWGGKEHGITYYRLDTLIRVNKGIYSGRSNHLVRLNDSAIGRWSNKHTSDPNNWVMVMAQYRHQQPKFRVANEEDHRIWVWAQNASKHVEFEREINQAYGVKTKSKKSTLPKWIDERTRQLGARTNSLSVAEFNQSIEALRAELKLKDQSPAQH